MYRWISWGSYVGPPEDWGTLIGDVPAATAILDRFLHHAEMITITGRSSRLRHQADHTTDGPKPANAPINSAAADEPANRRPRTSRSKRTKSDANPAET